MAVIAIRRVLAALAERGWTQAEFARRLGKDAGQVSRWLAGGATPSIYEAYRIFKVLGIEAWDWVTEDPEKSPLPNIPRHVRRPHDCPKRKRTKKAAPPKRKRSRRRFVKWNEAA